MVMLLDLSKILQQQILILTDHDDYYDYYGHYDRFDGDYYEIQRDFHSSSEEMVNMLVIWSLMMDLKKEIK